MMTTIETYQGWPAVKDFIMRFRNAPLGTTYRIQIVENVHDQRRGLVLRLPDYAVAMPISDAPIFIMLIQELLQHFPKERCKGLEELALNLADAVMGTDDSPRPTIH